MENFIFLRSEWLNANSYLHEIRKLNVFFLFCFFNFFIVLVLTWSLLNKSEATFMS